MNAIAQRLLPASSMSPAGRLHMLLFLVLLSSWAGLHTRVNCYSMSSGDTGAAQVSTVLGVVIREQREEKAWTEGVAIWVAILVVSLVGMQPH